MPKYITFFSYIRESAKALVEPYRANDPSRPEQRSGLIGRDGAMEVNDFPFASDPPQHERAPLACRFASKVKRDDGNITKFFYQQIQWTNWGDRAWCAWRVLREDRPECVLDLVPAADTSRGRRR